MTTTHLLYLHGFRSSPSSAKARQTAAHVAAHHPSVTFWCPQLPPSPRAAMALVAQGTAGWPRQSMAVIGSSLGGFYASWVAQQACCPSVMLNPAVDPARDLARHIGEQTAFHDPSERFYFREEFIGQFALLDPYPLKRPEQYWALIAQGDEVLDWREMFSHFEGAQVRLLDGSDHAVSDFAEHMPALLRWLGLPLPVKG